MKDLTRIVKHVRTDVLMAPNRSSKNNEETKGKNVELYKFDFSDTKVPLENYQDYLKKDEDGQRLNKDWHLVYSYSLPPQYDKLVEDALFAIPKHALDTIQYLLLNANLHAQNPLYKGYDTGIRESLGQISDEFIHKAIFLAFDYLYDPEVNYFRRMYDEEFDKPTLRDMTVYTFWRGRTGRGVQGWNAGFYGKGRTKYEYSESNEGQFYFYQEVRKYERLQQDMINISERLATDDNVDTVLEEESYWELDCPVEYGPDSAVPNMPLLKIYKVCVGHNGKELNKEGELVVTSGGKRSYKVVALKEAQALSLIKNHIHGEERNDKSAFGHYTEYHYDVSEISMHGLSPSEAGVIITEEHVK